MTVSLTKSGTYFFLFAVVLLAVMLLPRAAHAQSLPYPIDTNMYDNWLCHDYSNGYPGYGEHEPRCTTSEVDNTQIVGEFTITDLYGNKAEAYVLGDYKSSCHFLDCFFGGAKNNVVGLGYVNSSITVYPGEPLTYSWSLDPEMIVRHWECTNSFLGLCLDFSNVSKPRYYFYESGITSTFGQTSQYGSVVVTAPSSGTATSTISGPFGKTTSTTVSHQTCTTTGGAQGATYTTCTTPTYTTATNRPPAVRLSLQVVVSGSVPTTPLPTLAISADSQNIPIGGSTGIHATFAPGTGDTLTGAALDVVPSSGSEYMLLGNSPSSNYDYTFSTTTPGTYTFKPYAETTNYSTWSSYGQSVTVSVSNPLCSAASNGGATGTYPNCTCTSGSAFNASNNSCAALSSCTLNGITILSGNSITAYQSSSVTPPATCQSQIRTCTNGVLSGSYTYSSCAANAPGSISSALTATPSRVRPGGSTTLTWSTSNMASCAVTSSDSVQLSPLPSTALSSTGLITSAITHPEIYTLLCTDNNGTPFVSKVQVNLVPVVQEL